MKFQYLAAVALSQATLSMAGPIQGFSKRQTGGPDLGKPGADVDRACCRADSTFGNVCDTEVVPGGFEKEWMLHMQVSSNMDCGEGGTGCTLSDINSHTVGYSANVGANTPFTSIGFGVSESITTGESASCAAAPLTTVCIWTKVKHMEKDVRMVEEVAERDTCQGMADSQPHGPYRITAPIEEGTPYCVYGDACRSDGQSYWEEL